ncbi:hypothetical protein KAJ27_22855 [bacterium]|nr:hypothetical protein [bacterium]
MEKDRTKYHRVLNINICRILTFIFMFTLCTPYCTLALSDTSKAFTIGGFAGILLHIWEGSIIKKDKQEGKSPWDWRPLSTIAPIFLAGLIYLINSDEEDEMKNFGAYMGGFGVGQVIIFQFDF